MQINRKYKGIILMLMSAVCFATMSAFVRMSGNLPAMQKTFFRNFIAFFIALYTMKKAHVGFSGKKENIKYLVLRATFGTLGTLCNYYALDHLVLADANMLNKMSPFFAILFSALILKEKVQPAQAMIVVTAFLGSLLVVKPTGFNMDVIPALIGFSGGVCAGAAYTYVRKLSSCGEKGPFIVCFFSAFSCMTTLPALIFDYHPMTWVQFACLIMAGVMAAGGQFSITAAYSYAPAKEISVYDYSQIIFSAILGFFLFGQVPDLFSWIGYAIIIAMAIVMFIYNNKRN